MPPRTGQNSKSRSGLDVNVTRTASEKMTGGPVDKKDLYEYNLPDPNTGKPQEQKITIRAFRKFGFGGVGTFHTYVS